MNGCLAACNTIFNKTLELRKIAWESEKKSISLYDSSAYLPRWKAEDESLKTVYSQCLQNAQERVDLAFKAFFRRVKAGETPGYPRFKTNINQGSFTFPQAAQSNCLKDRRLKIPKVGLVKALVHRAIEGEWKTCTIKKAATGKWFAFIVVEPGTSVPPKVKQEKVVGIDLGLKYFAVLHTGEQVENPRFLKQSTKELKKASRKIGLYKTEAIKKARYLVRKRKISEKLVNRRTDFAHQLSRKLINKYDVICLEDLSIQEMLSTNRRALNRSIIDACWCQFLRYISYKAEWAGKRCILVDPSNTTKTCSVCGNIQALALTERTYKCCKCGSKKDRDVNAACNILAVGLHGLAAKPRSPGHQVGE